MFSSFRTSRSWPAPARLAIGLGCALAAAALRWAIDPLVHAEMLFSIFTGFVIVATLAGGVLAGTAAAFASAFLAEYLFVEPRLALPLNDHRDFIVTSVFLLMSAVVVQAAESWARSDADRETVTRFRRAVIDTLPAHVCLIDDEGVLVGVNREWAAFAQANGGDFRTGGLGENYLSVCDRASGPEAATARTVARGLRLLAAGGLPEFCCEYPCDSPNEERWFELRARRLVEGPSTYTVVSHYDVSERKRVELALAESEERYRSLFQGATEPLIVVDAESGEIVECNNALLRLTGFERQEVIGMPHGMFHSPSAVAGGCCFERRPAGAAGDTCDGTLRTKDGTAKEVECRAATIQAGGRTLLAGFFRDVSEQRASARALRAGEERLRQAQQLELVGRLAGGIAHNFNNMLAVIAGQAELALSNLAPGSVHDSLLEIHKAARRSADLTRQLLAFARKQSVRPRVLDLNQVVGATLALVRELAGSSVQVQWLPGERLWPVAVDASQLEQVLVNLALNARDSVVEGGHITIETANDTVAEGSWRCSEGVEPGQYVLVTVTDTGCGMSREVVAHAFEPFFTTKESGAGLGLAAIYGIVRQNGGFVNLRSEPGVGTTVTVGFARTPEKALDPARPPAALCPNAGRPAAVLLVEDAPDVRKLTSTMLKRLGYRVLVAEGPQEAIRLASNDDGTIDLLLTDVMMPEMNGRELQQRLVAMRPGLRSVFMSGYAADVITGSPVSEAAGFIQKPFSLASLREGLREALGVAQTPEAPV